MVAIPVVTVDRASCHHLGGALPSQLGDLGWARSAKGSRGVTFTAPGARALRERFTLERRAA